MKIKFIDIQNFRKLKKCRIHLGEKETLFVGANNSGKTSAIDSLVNFLDTEKQSRFSVTDFTLSNWLALNNFANSWSEKKIDEIIGNSLSEWQSFCPSIDVWLDVQVSEVHKVTHLIPTLKWNGEPLGVRLIYQPKDIEKLKIDFLQDFEAAKNLTQKKSNLNLWPRDMKHYLEEKLKTHFEIAAYILDPQKSNQIQSLSKDASPLESYPFNGLFKVNTVDAQRGHTDPNGENGKANGSLSYQLNEYYNRHLNPNDLPEESDIEALDAINSAQDIFDLKLEKAFENALGEIQSLGYPGFNDPNIQLSSKINPIESLNHEAAVVFNVQKDNLGTHSFSLPEKYNGLGYKNLIHIVFKLITYRDKWQRVGKAKKRKTNLDIAIEPIHLVLVEEPEAHLHAQVQQVFIRKAYDVLKKGIAPQFTTQMLVSSHSSYIANEAGFEKLRYFKRQSAIDKQEVPSATVIDLSKIFSSSENESDQESQIQLTAKFVSRYLKTVHCDLFFANGIILVEGAAERMLVPHFIKHNYIDSLNRYYISILEVGGAHAHRLRAMIDALGIPTLIITDTDAVSGNKKTRPARGQNQSFGSDTIKTWLGLKNKTLDEILDLPSESKIKANVRVAYQHGIQVKFNEGCEIQEAIPYTFEDAIVLSNLNLFRDLISPTGMVKKMSLATKEASLDLCCEKLFDALKGSKAEMALDILYEIDPVNLTPPKYITDGLDWLKKELELSSRDFIAEEIAVASTDKNGDQQ